MLLRSGPMPDEARRPRPPKLPPNQALRCIAGPVGLPRPHVRPDKGVCTYDNWPYGDDVAEPETTTLVRLALAMSLAIALATFSAATWTGSSAMLAAAIQALAAMSSQSLVLIGIKRTLRPATGSAPRHGNGDIYFWCYVAAALLFSMAAGVAIYDGALRLVKPQRIAEIEVAYWVATIAAAAQGYMLWRAVSASPMPAGGQGLAAALRDARNAPLLTVVAEGFAGLVGLALVLTGIALVHLAGFAWADGAASLALGLLLAAVAAFMSLEVRALLSNGDGRNSEGAAKPATAQSASSHDGPVQAPAPQTPPPTSLTTALDDVPAARPIPSATIPVREHASAKHRGKKKGRHRHR